MKVAYIFRNSMASTFQLGSMILPQLEAGNHGVGVVGMFFFDDNVFSLRADDEIGRRLSKIAEEQNILLMACDQCSLRRGLASGLFDECGTGNIKPMGLAKGVEVGCFPQLYEALSGNMPDQIITL